ncbi:MAG: tetratricopeptide repeat protein [Opitutales bacterium]
MSRNKTPVILVAVLLCALMLLPVLVLVVPRDGGQQASDEFERSGALTGNNAKRTGSSGSETANSDAENLAEEAEELIEGKLADRLRAGDISLDFMAGLKRKAEQADSALAKGDMERAKRLYSGVIDSAEGKLDAVEARETARAEKEATLRELKRLESLKETFGNAYKEAENTYEEAVGALNAGRFQASVDGFEMVDGILGDLEARMLQRVEGLLEEAEASLAEHRLEDAREAFSKVLEVAPDNTDAEKGLEMVDALEGIEAEVREIRRLEERGALEAARTRLEELEEKHPDNPFIQAKGEELETRLRDRKFEKAVAEAKAAEKKGDFSEAVKALERALELKDKSDLQEQLDALEEKQKARELEKLLEKGYAELSKGEYEAARASYKKAVELAPNSKEARRGLEKASGLHLAALRYRQNLASAQRVAEEGRYPLAAEFFNKAMDARPSNLPSDEREMEANLREVLDRQSSQVSVTIESDKRTYVSMVGVFPPERFREKERQLYPDVYKLRGTRKGYEDVELEVKVDARKPDRTFEVVCTEKK